MLLTGWVRSAGLRMAVVRTDRASALVRKATARLGSVLSAAGFDAIEVEAGAEVDVRCAVEEACDGGGVFATLALQSVANDSAVDVWIADSMTKKTSVRRVAVASPRSAAASREIASQGLDLLRASMLELESPRHSARTQNRALERPVSEIGDKGNPER